MERCKNVFENRGYEVTWITEDTIHAESDFNTYGLRRTVNGDFYLYDVKKPYSGGLELASAEELGYYLDL